MEICFVEYHLLSFDASKIELFLFFPLRQRYVMGKSSLMLNEEQCAFMAHYLKVHQQADGGWGTHIESPSTMFV